MESYSGPKVLDRILVQNDPVNWVDPLGLWTFAIDYSVTTGAGIGVTGGETFVIDGNGNYGIIDHSGAGGLGDIGGSAAVQYQITTAGSILDLGGTGTSVGGSVGPGVQATGELLFGDGYVGINLGLAAGPGLPAEVHGMLEYATVRPYGNIWDDFNDWLKKMLCD